MAIEVVPGPARLRLAGHTRLERHLDGQPAGVDVDEAAALALLPAEEVVLSALLAEVDEWQAALALCIPVPAL